MDVSVVKFNPEMIRLACELPVGRGLFIDLRPVGDVLKIDLWVKDGMELLQAWPSEHSSDFFSRREEAALSAGIDEVVRGVLGREMNVETIGVVIDAVSVVMKFVGGEDAD